MTRSYHLFLWLLVAALPSMAVATGAIDPNDPPQGRFSDEWLEVYMGGGKVGYAHLTMARDKELIHTQMTMELKIARAAQPVKVGVVQSTTETVAGVPLRFNSTTDFSMMKTSQRGAIKDGKVSITSSQYGIEQTQTFDFPPGALMTWGGFRESLLRGFTSGTQYTLKVYAPDLRLDDAVQAHTTIGDWDDLSHHGKRFRGQKVTLLMQSPLGSIEVISWIDEQTRTLKAIIPMPGLGNVSMIAADQHTAMADFVPPELFMTTTIKAKRSLEPRSIRRIKYRITTKSPDVELGELPTTGMQTLGKRDDHSAELVVTRQSHKPRAGGTPRPVDVGMAEYLEGNLMINVSDPKLIELAKKAAGGETEPFALADKLRRFVSDYVKDKTLNIGFATASEVCRNKEGDCSEHGVLLAALGRLCGLPSGVVIGVAYVPIFGDRDDIFGYHMWTQFFIDGRWIDVDAALKETECSPTRIAFATSSLKNVGLADLSLPLISKIGAIDIDILEVEEKSSPTD